ncbi:MAG: hypothetical protein ABI836_11485 [Gemmatimonadota bacterium]
MTLIRSGAWTTAVGLLLLSACVPGRPSPVGDACLTAADTAGTPLDTVVVALAPPENDRFLARHRNSTLVRLDCAGALRPELATQWSAEDGGRSWVFQLRPVENGGMTAGTVRDRWEALRNGGLWLWPAILQVEPVDSLRLRVRLDRGYAELPIEFADPRLGIPGGAFRLRYLATPRGGPVSTLSYLVPVTGTRPVIKVEQLRPGVDPRDALDFPRAGQVSPADIVITREAAAVAYARNRSEFSAVGVAWDQTYVLVTPPPGPVAAVSDETRRGLESGVVPGEVRAALPPFWWDSLSCLTTVRHPATDPRGGPIIGFLRSDSMAQALAERLAAVAPTGGTRTIAISNLDSAMVAGSPSALVLLLPRQRPVSCDGITGWPAGSRIDPLVDLRTFVITRRGVPALLLDADGMVRLNPAEGP